MSRFASSISILTVRLRHDTRTRLAKQWNGSRVGHSKNMKYVKKLQRSLVKV